MSTTTVRQTESSGGDEKKSRSSFLSMSIGGKSFGAKGGAGAGAGSKVLSLGGAPRANLLPPEVELGNKSKVLQRNLRLGVVFALLVAVVATGGSALLAVAAQANLVSAQTRTVDLLSQQGAHAEVRDVKTNVALSEAGQRVGSSTEINWKGYLSALQATLPGGVAITAVDTDTASPIADYKQSTVPLEGGRVGTLTFAATSPTLPEIPVWLNGLSSLTGFVDAVPNSVSIDTDGIYTVSITMHVNAAAYSGRFAPPAAEPDAPTAEGSEG